MISRPTFAEEELLWKKGYTVVGIDEVGRGSFAGPVITAAVVFNPNKLYPKEFFETIHDSKLLTEIKRNKLDAIIKNNCQAYAIAQSPVPVINKLGIGKATHIAFRKVVSLILKKVEEKKVYVLIDGFYVKYIQGIGLSNQKAIVKGDQKSISIASSSVIAKVHRDTIMRGYDKSYPEYLFGKHKGYGTKDHQHAIHKHGLCKLHRLSFNLSQFL